MGSTKVQCNAITRNLWLWCISRNMWIKALHLPGSDNIAADKQSRTTGLETEWSVSSTVFDNLNSLFGPFDVDSFARRINHKLPSYVSWKKDATAWKINAFSVRWSNIYSYAFPPFRLILRCLKNRHGVSGLCNNHSWVEIPSLVHQTNITLGGCSCAVAEEIPDLPLIPI